MRIVRESGDVSLLLPEGIDHFADAPYTLHQSILSGLRFVRMQELPLEEQPPRRIWLKPEEMEAWWKKVDRDRREKYGIKGDPDDEGEPGVDYDENDVALIARG